MSLQRELKVVGIDLAKNVFQVHGRDAKGRQILQKRISRTRLLSFVSQMPRCLIGIEACGGAHHWAREFTRLGHDVKMMAPQLVAPYRSKAKNDYNDAAAISEAVTRPDMRFVPIKQTVHQDIQTLHCEREQMIGFRTRLCNNVRGLLAEYGLVAPKGRVKLMQALIGLKESSMLSEQAKRIVLRVYDRLQWVNDQLQEIDQEVNQVFESNPVCKQLEKLPGVGKITATAILGTISQPDVFKKGREVSAWLGVVPKQSSSGQTQQLGRITKHGDRYLRKLLVHGGRSVVRTCHSKSDRFHQWVQKKHETRGYNRASVAVANRNARHIWAVLMLGDGYRAVA